MEMNEAIRARFWSKVDKRGADECWEWKARDEGARYGRLRLRGRLYLAHRLSWIVHRGVIPTGMHVLHRCDNGFCVNPAHLWLGTHQENMKDRDNKGRAAGGKQPGEKNPASKLTADDVRMIRKMRADGMLYKEIAEYFPINQYHARDVAVGRRWKHIK